jgi:hypothetical protein
VASQVESAGTRDGARKPAAGAIAEVGHPSVNEMTVAQRARWLAVCARAAREDERWREVDGELELADYLAAREAS